MFVSSRSFGFGPRFCRLSRGSSFKQIPSVLSQSVWTCFWSWWLINIIDLWSHDDDPVRTSSSGRLSLSPSASEPLNDSDSRVVGWFLMNYWVENSVDMPLEYMTVSVGICLSSIYCCRLKSLTAGGGNGSAALFLLSRCISGSSSSIMELWHSVDSFRDGFRPSRGGVRCVSSD